MKKIQDYISSLHRQNAFYSFTNAQYKVFSIKKRADITTLFSKYNIGSMRDFEYLAGIISFWIFDGQYSKNKMLVNKKLEYTQNLKEYLSINLPKFNLKEDHLDKTYLCLRKDKEGVYFSQHNIFEILNCFKLFNRGGLSARILNNVSNTKILSNTALFLEYLYSIGFNFKPNTISHEIVQPSHQIFFLFLNDLIIQMTEAGYFLTDHYKDLMNLLIEETRNHRLEGREGIVIDSFNNNIKYLRKISQFDFSEKKHNILVKNIYSLNYVLDTDNCKKENAGTLFRSGEKKLDLEDTLKEKNPFLLDMYNDLYKKEEFFRVLED